MSGDFVRHLHVLLKADSLIGRIWLTVVARRFGLLVFAGLIAVFGLGMMDIAAFFALQASVGSVWAAAIIAVVDFLLAAIVLLASRYSQPGPEIDLAFEVRKMAIEAIQADARDLKVTVDAFGQEVRSARDSIAEFAHNPLDAAVQKFLIPAATSIITGLRSKKDKNQDQA